MSFGMSMQKFLVTEKKNLVEYDDMPFMLITLQTRFSWKATSYSNCAWFEPISPKHILLGYFSKFISVLAIFIVFPQTRHWKSIILLQYIYVENVLSLE